MDHYFEIIWIGQFSPETLSLLSKNIKKKNLKWSNDILKVSSPKIQKKIKNTKNKKTQHIFSLLPLMVSGHADSLSLLVFTTEIACMNIMVYMQTPTKVSDKIYIFVD